MPDIRHPEKVNNKETAVLPKPKWIRSRIPSSENFKSTKEIIKKRYNKIVISPGPGNPNQSGNCLNILKTLHKDFPFLGVCLGHQIIGQVFGSKIVQAKKLMHGKTSIIKSNKMSAPLYKRVLEYLKLKSILNSPGIILVAPTPLLIFDI